MTTNVSIYALHCPKTMEIRYIGKANDPEKRLKSHMRDSLRRNTPVYCWINSLRDKGVAPVMTILSVVGTGEWEDEERRLIGQYRANGARLLNLADGGNEPLCTKENRKKAGAAASTARMATDRSRLVWKLKREMGYFLKNHPRGDFYDRIVDSLRYAANKKPELFGVWSTL